MRNFASRVRNMDAGIAGPRIRAARGYAGLTNEQLADVTGIGEAKLRGLMQQAPRGTVGLEELYKIADATKVPRWFMEHGFAVVDETALRQGAAAYSDPVVLDLLRRVQRLERGDDPLELAELETHLHHGDARRDAGITPPPPEPHDEAPEEGPPPREEEVARGIADERRQARTRRGSTPGSEREPPETGRAS